MAEPLDALQADLDRALGLKIERSIADRGEITIVVKPSDLSAVLRALRDDESLAFSTLIDLIGMDYAGFADDSWKGPRFAVVYLLLSIRHNRRVRVKTICASDELPMIDSAIDTWPAANWFEREAFDLYGIVFKGHPDLRRILTDYGFVGHPFRKDFPIAGHVEMRYDSEQKRVIYQPVTIEPREIVPRVIREEHYGDAGKK